MKGMNHNLHSKQLGRVDRLRPADWENCANADWRTATGP